MSTTQAASPTHLLASGWRMWVPCVGMALCSLLSFVDRGVLCVLATPILDDTGMTVHDMCTIDLFFCLAYTCGNPLWGSLSDHLGLRTAMLLAVGLFAEASEYQAWMSGFVAFPIARDLLVLGQGSSLPGGVRTAVQR